MQQRLVKFITFLFYQLTYMFIEKPRGLDFIRPYEKLSKKNRSIHMYGMPPGKLINKLFHGYKIDQSDSILDIGCGKGFTLYNFSKAGFHKIHGIELIQSLCEIAKRNMKRLKIEDKVTIECINAVEYEDLEQFTYIYMFNPFPMEIMRKVINNIEQSLRKHPRELIIIYVNPTCSEIIAQSKLLELVEKRYIRSRRRKQSVYYYRSKNTENSSYSLNAICN